MAVCDPLGITASPLEVVEGSDLEAKAARIAVLAAEHGAARLVVGLPVNMDGSTHDSAGRVEAFAQLCGARAGLPVEYVDERLTTVQAERHLWDAGLSHKKRKSRVDKVAAVLLLQSWLDQRG